MDIIKRHEWARTPQAAIALQQQLATEIIHDRPVDINAVRFVAGVDVSVKDNVSQAAVVVLSFPDLRLVETVTYQLPTPFPYIPGLLSFREGPVLEEAFRCLKYEPDVFIFDGMGRIHPRRIGIASHLGLWLNKPTIGCGKTYMLGELIEPPVERGSYSELRDRGELVGVTLRTKTNVKPVFISVGHLCNLDFAVELVMRCTTKYRLPEPIRAAHQKSQMTVSE